MPVYTYHCNACGKEFDVSQRMSDAPLNECECGEKGQVQRLIGSGAGLIFKGSGFYITDYKNGSNGSNGSNDSNGSTPSKGSSSPESKASSGGDSGCGSSACCMNKKD